MSNIICKLKSEKTLSNQETWKINVLELTTEANFLIRGSRIVMLETLCPQILEELHMQPFRVVRMKGLARGHCWWPNIYNAIENLSRNCESCQQYEHNHVQIEKHVWELPTALFSHGHVEFADPFMKKIVLILVDAYQKWPETFFKENLRCRQFCRRNSICEKLCRQTKMAFRRSRKTNREIALLHGHVH